ncbi:winged helix-turn-helix transcriptional regulator [Methanohalobium sp.]|uniref:winged helix-turn-helix transcriptional regulator n=1 Tax=Methanohalobium sp. TaxID=2837493 RepID=UPI0025FD442A|nr:winged helix-turn-helix transcriptional regulator [Methanohalobium sp.]
MSQRIILNKLDKPKNKSLESDAKWICESLGFSSGRDIENTSTKVIISLLKNLSNDGVTSSEAVAQDLDIKVSRVNYHIRNLINSGLVYREKKLLHLRGGSLKTAIQEMRKDTDRIFEELEYVAEGIDNKMGLKNR